MKPPWRFHSPPAARIWHGRVTCTRLWVKLCARLRWRLRTGRFTTEETNLSPLKVPPSRNPKSEHHKRRHFLGFDIWFSFGSRPSASDFVGEVIFLIRPIHFTLVPQRMVAKSP